MAKLTPTLLRAGSALASPEAQREFLAQGGLSSFEAALSSAGQPALQAAQIDTLQINVGKRCNQTCRHCHVDAGPDRKEVMPGEIVEACLRFLIDANIPTLDITGGAPELHPQFREIVERASAAGRRVMDRCNLTITRLPNYAYLPEFFAQHRVEVVASLPWFTGERTDSQRGDGVFEQSLATLTELNALGYGKDGTGLVLNLVTNPTGAFLPANQRSLERDWRFQLKRRFGIEFNNLFTITNMPVSRFLSFLVESDNYESYMTRLVNAFNPATVEGLMCRTTLSVGWDGRLFDCDFNQMLDLALPQTILQATREGLEGRAIKVARHCFGCTAGSGSSCGGATAG